MARWTVHGRCGPAGRPRRGSAGLRYLAGCAGAARLGYLDGAAGAGSRALADDAVARVGRRPAGSGVGARVGTGEGDDPQAGQLHAERAHVVLEVVQLQAAVGELRQRAARELPEREDADAPVRVEQPLYL